MRAARAKVWERLNEWRYRHIPTGTLVEREDPPNNSHFSIWSITGKTGHFFSTRKDLQAFLERAPSKPSTKRGNP